MPTCLRDELNSLLQLAGVPAPEIVAQLDHIRARASATGTTEVRGLATNVVLLDRQRAEDLID